MPCRGGLPANVIFLKVSLIKYTVLFIMIFKNTVCKLKITHLFCLLSLAISELPRSNYMVYLCSGYSSLNTYGHFHAMNLNRSAKNLNRDKANKSLFCLKVARKGCLKKCE